MEDTELFELCKSVFEITNWKLPASERPVEYWVQHDDEWDLEYGIAGMPIDGGIVPLYTSDYLLEKLSPVVQDPFDNKFRHIQMWINGDKSAHAAYVEPYAHDDRAAYAQNSDEMRKTLLKLTIALIDAGVKL